MSFILDLQDLDRGTRANNGGCISALSVVFD